MLLFRMKSARQPVSLAVHGRLSPQFRSDFRPPAFRKPPVRPLSVASLSPMEGLSVTHRPQLTTHSPLTTFRINTCKSVSKQTTLTTFRMNTYEKRGGGVGVSPLAPCLCAPACPDLVWCQIHYFQVFAASLGSFGGSRRLFSAT
jgi:hypothetical protein